MLSDWRVIAVVQYHAWVGGGVSAGRKNRHRLLLLFVVVHLNHTGVIVEPTADALVSPDMLNAIVLGRIGAVWRLVLCGCNIWRTRRVYCPFVCDGNDLCVPGGRHAGRRRVDGGLARGRSRVGCSRWHFGVCSWQYIILRGRRHSGCAMLCSAVVQCIRGGFSVSWYGFAEIQSGNSLTVTSFENVIGNMSMG